MTEEEKRAQEAAAAAAAQPSEQPAQPAAPVITDPLQGQKLTINGQEVNASEYITSRLNQMAEDELRKQYELEQKRMERRKLGESIGEFSAVIGDMIKAGNGALVTPRDFRQTYNALDARQRQLFDREMARREAEKRLAEQRRQREEERKQAAQQREEELRLRKEIAEMQEEGRNKRAEEAKAAKIEAERIKADSRVRAHTTPSGEQEIVVPFAGQDYPIKKKIYDGRMAQLYAYMEQNDLFPEASQANDDLKAIMYLMGSADSSKAPETSKGKLITAVNVALGYIKADSKHAANIIAILQGTYGSRPPQQTQQTSTKPVGSNNRDGQKKKVNW